MILLTDEEIKKASDMGAKAYKFGHNYECLSWYRPVAKAQLKKALISVGKESKRMDGTIYLVPDYVEYRKALKEVGLE